ncbi:hypothetical protein VIN01S_24500 [Vibrio inusitatus NBRC 102082]|uniref:Uncharacterized protein n=1 Tax=Vibrio inusitatus NBRC 102082 TaxID=1219070 RepID=A0A4Y3HWZ3_9VIBR|nr:hypothetical protein [Vibrio inusitatus]GEA51646.1 hypothetical protein VIN01S_24500 [Vibrio inusitatus NBRC 102082]
MDNRNSTNPTEIDFSQATLMRVRVKTIRQYEYQYIPELLVSCIDSLQQSTRFMNFGLADVESVSIALYKQGETEWWTLMDVEVHNEHECDFVFLFCKSERQIH